MALRVWLPLNGNLENHGLSSCVVVNSGAAIDNSGKIGKTYLFDANDDFISIDGADIRNIFKGGDSPFTIAFWIYNTKATGTRAVPFGDYGLTGTIQFNLELNSSAGNWNDDIRFYWNGNPDYRATGTSATPNTWVHLAIVYDGTKVEFYRNGILVNTRTGTLAALNKTSGVFYLGRDSRTGGTAFGGKLNDFRVYDEALSLKQIKKISKGLVVHYKLTGVGANPNLLVDAGNRSKWTYESCTRVNDTDSKAIGFTVSSANQRIYLGVTNVWNSGQKYTYSFDAKASVNDAQLDASRSIADFGPNHYLTTEWQHYSGKISSTATADAGTLSIRGKTANTTYYLKNIKLENGEEETNYIPNINDIEYTTSGYENDICTDVSGNGYAATKSGTLTFNLDSPRYDGSTTFDLARVNSPAGAVLAASKDFTINGWFYHTSGTTYYASAETYNTSVCLESGRFFVYSSSGSPYVGTWSATNNVWQMITLVHDSVAKTLTLFVNGVQTAQVTTDGTIYANNTLNIGGRQNGAEYKGSMSDFRIYATALSADDIKNLYMVRASIDNSKNYLTYEFKEPDIDFFEINNLSGATNLENNSYLISHTAAYDGASMSISNFVIGKTYKMSYYFQKIDGSLQWMGGHAQGYSNIRYYIDGKYISAGYVSNTTSVDFIDDTDIHFAEVYFTCVGGSTNDALYIQPNRGKDVATTVKIYNLKFSGISFPENNNMNIDERGLTCSTNLLQRNDRSNITENYSLVANSFIEI